MADACSLEEVPIEFPAIRSGQRTTKLECLPTTSWARCLTTIVGDALSLIVELADIDDERLTKIRLHCGLAAYRIGKVPEAIWEIEVVRREEHRCRISGDETNSKAEKMSSRARKPAS